MPLPDDPTPALLSRLNQNIMALGCAIEEIGIWIKQRGATEVSVSIEDHLAVITANADFIAETIAELIARCEPEEEEIPKTEPSASPWWQLSSDGRRVPPNLFIPTVTSGESVCNATGEANQ
ncbi:hypothetical protein [Pseudomonas fluorescens]